VAGRLVLGPWLNRIGRSMNALALEQLELSGDENVLEVGFGGGGLLASILRHTAGDVFGVDVSAPMVARARRRFPSKARLRLFQGSVEALPMAEASVERACSVNNIYFWENPPAAMKELARVVRPGGTLSICFEPAGELRKWPGHRFGFSLFEESEIRDLMTAAGFTAIRRVEGRGRKPEHFVCLTGVRQRAEAAS
jgi:arsenite methyltransferase